MSDVSLSMNSKGTKSGAQGFSSLIFSLVVSDDCDESSGAENVSNSSPAAHSAEVLEAPQLEDTAKRKREATIGSLNSLRKRLAEAQAAKKARLNSDTSKAEEQGSQGASHLPALQSRQMKALVGSAILLHLDAERFEARERKKVQEFDVINCALQVCLWSTSGSSLRRTLPRLRELRHKKLVEELMCKHGLKSAAKRERLLAAAQDEADEALEKLVSDVRETF